MGGAKSTTNLTTISDQARRRKRNITDGRKHSNYSNHFYAALRIGRNAHFHIGKPPKGSSLTPILPVSTVLYGRRSDRALQNKG